MLFKGQSVWNPRYVASLGKSLTESGISGWWPGMCKSIGHWPLRGRCQKGEKKFGRVQHKIITEIQEFCVFKLFVIIQRSPRRDWLEEEEKRKRRRERNKAGYTATLVACGWTGAMLEKVTRASGPEPYAQKAQKRRKSNMSSKDCTCDPMPCLERLVEKLEWEQGSGPKGPMSCRTQGWISRRPERAYLRPW